MMLTPHKRAWERPFQSSKAKHALFKGPGGTEELARAATRNEPWGPTGTQLNELATLSHQGQCDVIFGILRERLEDPRSSRWRKVYKALQTVEFLAKRGAPCCVMSAQQLTPIMQLLQETYTHHSSDGKDTGKNVRIRAAAVVCLLQDVEGLNAEREYFAKRAAAGQLGVVPGELGVGADGAPEQAETQGAAGSPDGTSVNDGAFVPSGATPGPHMTGGRAAEVASPSSPMKVQMTPEQKAEVCAALARVLTLDGNAVCADCGQAEGMRPTWASTSCGVFLCMRCAGIHRSLGVHVSKVRSITMDKWTPSLVDALERAGGNARANAYYEALLPQGHARPKNQEVERFIFNKYALRRWAQPDAEWPPPPPYSAAAAADVIATSTYDLQHADGTPSAAPQSTAGGGAVVDAAAGGGMELRPEGKEGGAAHGGSHAWAQQPSDAQGGADAASPRSVGATKEGSQAADTEAAQMMVEFEGVVLGQEVLSVAMGMVSQMRGKQRLPASVVPADVSGVASSCSAAVLRAARAGGSTSSALRGTLMPPMPPPSPPKATPPPMEPPRPATPPVPEPQPEEQKAELGDLLGPELGGEEEQGESARLQEKEEEDTGLAAELQALPPMLESTAHPSPPHAAPCAPNPKIWTPRPPFYVTTNPPPPPLLLPPSYPEELRPPLPPLLLPPQHIEEPMPGQFLLGAPPLSPLPNGYNGPNAWNQGPPQSFAEPPPPPSAQPRPPVLQESPTLQLGLEELAAVVPAGKQQDGGACMAAQSLAPMAAVPAPATPPVATPALAFTTPGTAPALARAPAPLQPWVGTKREESFSALASPPTPPACAQPPMQTCAEPTLGVPPPPTQLPTNCAEPTLGFVPPPLAQPPTHCAEPTLGVSPLLAPPPPPPESSMANASVASTSVANAPAAAAEPILGMPGPSSVTSTVPASAAMASEESLPPTGEAAPPPANAEACSAMQSSFASSAAAAAAAACM